MHLYIRGAQIIFDFWGRSQKAVSADPITNTDLFKAIFYHVELFILILQSVFLDIYSVPEFHFWKWGEVPRDSCERGFFNLRGGGGIFRHFFQKYTFISHKCLIIQCIFVFTIVQLLQKSLHTAQAWIHTGVHYWSICLPQTTFIHYFDFKSKHCHWKCFFVVILFFYSNNLYRRI